MIIPENLAGTDVDATSESVRKPSPEYPPRTTTTPETKRRSLIRKIGPVGTTVGDEPYKGIGVESSISPPIAPTNTPTRNLAVVEQHNRGDPRITTVVLIMLWISSSLVDAVDHMSKWTVYAFGVLSGFTLLVLLETVVV